ncbi:hypothetical protein C8R44DRAFT_851208 [Mycena epipterygia]|nr:hypothetical protein C8R44DRAFT_851208 [Mycena epipterygia]
MAPSGAGIPAVARRHIYALGGGRGVRGGVGAEHLVGDMAAPDMGIAKGEAAVRGRPRGLGKEGLARTPSWAAARTGTRRRHCRRRSAVHITGGGVSEKGQSDKRDRGKMRRRRGREGGGGEGASRRDHDGSGREREGTRGQKKRGVRGEVRSDGRKEEIEKGRERGSGMSERGGWKDDRKGRGRRERSSTPQTRRPWPWPCPRPGAPRLSVMRRRMSSGVRVSCKERGGEREDGGGGETRRGEGGRRRYTKDEKGKERTSTPALSAVSGGARVAVSVGGPGCHV